MVMMKTCFLVGASLLLAGCGDRIRQPSPEELARFQTADQARPTVDMDRVLQAKIVAGPYRAVPGDVLRLEMPKFPDQQSATTGTDSRQTYNCRIGDDGTIVLPMVGPLPVWGKSLAEIESAIAAQYYPKYVAAPLPVYVSVLEYQTKRVSIAGAVTQPGIYSLRHDQMSLVALLMQAGGIVGQGAAVIRINRTDGPGPRAENGGQSIHPIRSPSSEIRPPVLRAVFEREGPLRTTGWLRVEQDKGEVSVRKWLDIGNEPQRREFFHALASQSKWPGTEDLAAKLARLGAYLDGADALGDGKQDGDSRAKGNDSKLQTSSLRLQTPQDWQVDNGCFVTVAYGWAGDRDLPSRTVAAKTPVEVGYAVGSARQGAPRIREGRSGPLPSPREGTPNAKQRVWEPEPVPGATRVNPPRSQTPTQGEEQNVRQAPGVQRDPKSDTSPLGTQTLVLPVRGLNIPFADVVLEEGDTVVVEPPREQSISIVGLVGRPGNMPYPSGARYTLIQAIAFAGGLDLVAGPRYVSVYRLAPDGQIVSITFQLVNPRRQQQLMDALAIPLKPGDVVSVEHTPRTRTNVFFDRVFRISLGLYATPDRLWNG
jgi:protein involved in polysaccharide export with SLBB domain